MRRYCELSAEQISRLIQERSLLVRNSMTDEIVIMVFETTHKKDFFLNHIEQSRYDFEIGVDDYENVGENVLNVLERYGVDEDYLENLEL